MPGVVIVVVATFHTAAGSVVIDEAIEPSESPSEVEAVSTVVLVFAFMTVASELEAMPTRVSVFALIAVWLLVIAEPRDEVAVCTSLSVARLPLVSPAPVSVRVPFVQTSAAKVPKPVRVRVPEAHMSAASVPKVVSERVPFAQMSATSVPKEVRVLPENAQMEFGRVAARDEEAFATAVFVFAFTSAATEDDETRLSVISKVLSPRTRLPFPELPQVMNAGQMPLVSAGVKEYSYQLFAVAVIEAAFTATDPFGS